MSSSTGNIRALLIIIAALVALWFSPIAKAEVLERHTHWRAYDTMIQSDFTDKGISHSVAIDSEARVGVMLFEGEAREELGKVAIITDEVMTVNGRRVRVEVTYYEDGGLWATAKTKDGMMYMAEQLWNKPKVTFKLQEYEFWISAKGVRAAWNTVINKGAI